jgi:hypothetical protein
MKSCIKTIELYYKVSFVVTAVLNFDWLIWRISLYVSLGSHRYGTLEGNLAYVPVMDPGIGPWHKFTGQYYILSLELSVLNYNITT